MPATETTDATSPVATSQCPAPGWDDTARGLLAALQLAAAVFDPEGRTVLWNPEAEALFGWSASEVIGRPVPFVPQGRETECASVRDAIRRGERLVQETERLRRDGSRIEVRLTAAPMSGAGGSAYVVVTFEDISQRRRADRAHAAVRRVLELLATATPLDDVLAELVGIVEGHSRSGMLGSIRLLDPASGRLQYGAAPSLPAEFNRAIDGMVSDAVPTDATADGERELALAHGLHTCWSAEILGGTGDRLGTFTLYNTEPCTPDSGDLSLFDVVTRTAMLAIERRRSEATLQRRSAQFKTLLDQAPLGMFLVDAAFDILAINPSALEALGDVGNVVGRNFATVVHAVWPQRLADEVVVRFRQTLETGEPFVAPEFIDRRPTRQAVGYYHWQVNRIVLANGGYGLVCYFKDISDAVRARMALSEISVVSDRQRRLYDTVLSNAPDLIYAFDLQHRFTYANAALLTTWGKSLDEAVGRTCLELGYEAWHAAMHDREIEQVVATRKPIRGEVPFDGTRGRRIWEYIFVPIIGPDGNVEAVAGTSRDVTERRRVEDNVRDSERLLGQVFEAAPAFMAVLRGPDLVIEKANAAYHALVGEGRAVIGMPLLDALPELVGSPYPDILRRVIDTGDAYHGKAARVALARSADAELEERWVDYVYEALRGADGEVSGVMIHGVDLTERVVAENALRRSEQRLRFVMDSMPQKIFASTADGRVDYLNPVWGEFTGMSAEVMQDWSRFIHPDDFEDNLRLWKRSIETGEPFLYEHRFRRADGAYRWHLSRAVAMKDGDGNVLMWIGASTDIHEQREAAGQLRALAVELADADRRKDEFIALLAHELRNPLAPISNALQIMRLADGRKESTQFAAAVMERQIGQLVRLVDDLLDVSRISRGKVELRRETLALESAVVHAVEAARPLARSRDQSLVVSLPTERLEVSADPIRLAQIIGNLLNNAVKFTDHGGSIRLEVEHDGEEAVLRVIDTGIGIDPEQIPRIFEMFTQLDTSLERSVSGLGIGLSLVRSLVEMHGGTILAHSRGRGHGAQFTVRLPLRPGSGGPTDPAGD